MKYKHYDIYNNNILILYTKMFTKLTSYVYLCLATDNNFECKQFKDFIEADEYFTDKCSYNVLSTMINRCKFYPDALKLLTLKKEITKTFSIENVNVTIVKDFDPKYLSKDNSSKDDSSKDDSLYNILRSK